MYGLRAGAAAEDNFPLTERHGTRLTARGRSTMRARALLSAAALLGTGCLTSGMYRTAHVLPEGEGDLSMNVNVVRATVDEPRAAGAGSATFTYPNLVPEISYHYGVAPDAEVGGRIALGVGMFEVDAKYRFFHGDAVHLAIQPAAGYRSMLWIEGFHATLPLILTQDLKPGISLNVSAFGTYTHFTATEDFGEDDLDFRGDTLNAGGALGFEFRTPSGFHFMPALEVQRSVHRSGDIADAPEITAVILGVTLGWGADERARKVDRQLDRIERKVDRLDRAPDAQPAAPPPSPAPAQ